MMEIIRDLNAVPIGAKGAVLAIGNFDGVHEGHKGVLALGRQIAEQKEPICPLGVMIFTPHPRLYFQPSKPHFRLTTLDQKLGLFEGLNLDFTVILEFNAALAALEAEDFVKTILVDALAVRHVVVGYNFYFGKGRQGDTALLTALGEKYGFETTIVTPQQDKDGVFSSTRIREALRDGNMKAAREGLGYWWKLTGVVEKGAGRGANMGFPTANIPLEDGMDLKFGIYATRIIYKGLSYDGACYVGTRPTFDNGRPAVEVYIFDFDEKIYGHEIAIEFIEFLREDQEFASAESLMKQIDIDCENAKRILAQV